MQLCQLPAEADGAVWAKAGKQLPQCCQQSVGRFVEDHGPRLRAQLVQPGLPLLLLRWQEPFKGEAACRQRGDAQGGDRRAGAGDRTDRDLRLGRQAGQVLSRVRDRRGPGVCHQGAGLPLGDADDNLRPGGSLVVLVIAHQGFMQLQMVQQLPGDTGVLGGDKIRFGQRLAAAVRDIGQIADGGGDEI